MPDALPTWVSPMLARGSRGVPVDQAEHATKASAQLEAAFGGILDGTHGQHDATVIALPA